MNALTLGVVAAATGGALHGAPELPLGGVSIDSRTIGRGELFVAVAGPRFDGHDFVAGAKERGAAAALVARPDAAPAGLPHVVVADTTKALADLARHVRRESGVKVAAVTGSAGKTTTKEMLAALLATAAPTLKTEGNLNNQYGLPLTLLRLRPEHRYAALELGMSAPGELRALSAIAAPDVAAITMVGRAHLEFFRDADEIALAKAEILEGLGQGGIAVLNRDDARVRGIGERFPGRVLWFGHDRSCDASFENWRGTIHGMRFDLRLGGEVHDVALALAGRHNVANFVAAALCAHALGLAPAQVAAAAAGLSPARRRGEVQALGSGVTLLDDSYNANPEAVAAAVAALGLAAKGRRVAFLGDMLELGPQAAAIHEATAEAAAKGLDVLVAAGAHAEALARGAVRGGLAASAVHAFADSAAAAGAAPGLVRPGDAVLVKGSRGSRMDVVADALVAALGRA
ncbi:MAG: UDP-N-acetylmuramoyl-tripeptide--D-alanyl-D-alanine ligase [Vicinamibacteria bacterium]|nr:UDP-N-acetylmuramoyl-tripeptide--D-alanyl-D-alanine ligase [Vicinamibacteria bacterium]